jgi:translation initiation factor 2 subunit 2
MPVKYEQMLDKLYKNMPQRKATTERFEPPVFLSFYQGNQTFIRNFGEVASKLRRDTQHILKYLSKELATAGSYDGKRVMLQGKFRDEQLNSRLTAYIEEYVLCKECGKPDTELTTYEGIKYKRCEVCGARAPTKAV